ncbi:helix-turn-helix domain-containing protein [Niallia taxi]|uniref:helix-turn-helix domain-containing protein n=1 Tax=Niallia taxi TaxID=2499688 RepID=UPI003008AC93
MGSKDEVIGKCLLLNLLERSKMTQVDLSVVTGISKQEINRYINSNRTMSLSNARLVSKALNCNIEDLYEWKV